MYTHMHSHTQAPTHSLPKRYGSKEAFSLKLGLPCSYAHRGPC